MEGALAPQKGGGLIAFLYLKRYIQLFLYLQRYTFLFNFFKFTVSASVPYIGYQINAVYNTGTPAFNTAVAFVFFNNHKHSTHAAFYLNAVSSRQRGTLFSD